MYPLEVNIIKVEKLTPNDTTSTNSYSYQVLVKGQRLHLHNLSDYFDLNEESLEDNRYKQYEYEEPVVEETWEDIDFRGQQFFGIDLIEDLQHHIHIEEKGVVAGHTRVFPNINITSELIFFRDGLCVASIIDVWGFLCAHVFGDIAACI